MATMPTSPKRRRDDDDWKVSAPRWMLVSIIVVLLGILPLFGATLMYLVRGHVAFTLETASKVGTVQEDVADVKRRTTNVENALVGVNESILSTQVDMLRYQAYMARRNGDKAFAADLDHRAMQAENKLKQDARGTR
jgi:hypothetical protein